ncbi:hypothetical protein PGT21_006328 [Puccinia graminis f. sp. tritici]|uniref:Uncharacterized protein n=1 Tax=Puccinia graminis f. sp. tritici TaxID=56615 RepID=A0A5B0M5B6_PUCGR|nr:hypothetical protein PGT21_006328 [Puccinia graminis f. sp. tritici]
MTNRDIAIPGPYGEEEEGICPDRRPTFYSRLYCYEHLIQVASWRQQFMKNSEYNLSITAKPRFLNFHEPSQKTINGVWNGPMTWCSSTVKARTTGTALPTLTDLNNFGKTSHSLRPFLTIHTVRLGERVRSLGMEFGRERVSGWESGHGGTAQGNMAIKRCSFKLLLLFLPCIG